MKVLLTGAAGMLGSNILMESGRFSEIKLVPVKRSEGDLSDKSTVVNLLTRIKPDVVVHAAALVGGIKANLARPVDFLAKNVLLDCNLMTACSEYGIEKFLYIASSCMYPKDYRQPLVEKDILQAPLEPSNEGYALAKIVGSRLTEYISSQMGLDYRTIVPSNLYGPGDHYDLDSSHLVAATIRKVLEAKETNSEIVVWGDGTARREFTFISDLASWILKIIPRMNELPSLLNVGAGYDKSVEDYYRLAMQVVGYEGNLVFDSSKPTGMKQKLLDSSIAFSRFDWSAPTRLEDGMSLALKDYIDRRVV